MDVPKYDGNIHPNEWINDIQKYFKLKKINGTDCLEIAVSSVDPTISLPDEIDSFEKLCNTLIEDISFKVFKNTNEKMLQSLKYIPENKGGNTSKFISKFRKLCYNAEINDIEEQKKYLYKSLPINHFDSILIEFYKKMENVDSINKLIKEFEDFVDYESKLIINESIVALKHVNTGNYLSSMENLCYETGVKSQLVFVQGSPEPGPNSLWKIKFINKELATCGNTHITLQHVKSKKFLGLNYGKLHYDTFGDYVYNYYEYLYHKSPSTDYTEVSCNDITNSDYWVKNWEFNYDIVESHQGFLKSNDIINLSIKKMHNNNGKYISNGQYEFLRSHDIQFTIGKNAFQEVVCHSEKLGENDKWCIELIKQYIWTLD
ncbi:hypothetical protein RhiirA1_450655 [Rhizophagus irregularis]|uniref:Uncharacterized protein n=3 Tax=Rhizophagus irregularis TaxID=588596 RepID=A0A2I1ERK6_9GLOM|nr:hypothetical protein RhiirA1_450655 [Rhizophagus irregularis]PKY24760.1 hypothetical protein RhiirB3_509250 [Rhizophagus irregularis]